MSSNPFRAASYYCLICPLTLESIPYNSRNGIFAHLGHAHDCVDGEDTIDYCNGWSAHKIHGRRQVESEKQGALAARYFAGDNNYGLDDLLTDF